MKLKFRKTQLAVAVAAAAVFGITTAADAASFVRVPTTANAQISNGGLSPAGDSESSGSGDGSSGSATINLSVGSEVLQHQFGYWAKIPVSVNISGLPSSGDILKDSVTRVGTLTVQAQKGVSPIVRFSDSSAGGFIASGTNPRLSTQAGVVILPYRVGVSNDGSCANAQWADQSATGDLTLAPSTTKAGQSYSICVTTPYRPGAQTYENGEYSTKSLEAANQTPSAAASTKLSLATSTVQLGDTPAGVSCTIGFRFGWLKNVLQTPSSYDVYASTDAVASPTTAFINCTNTTNADEQVGYTVTAPSSGVAVGSATGDSMSYNITLAAASGTITVPANGNASANPQVTVSIPAGQDVAVDSYAGTVPVTLKTSDAAFQNPDVALFVGYTALIENDSDFHDASLGINAAVSGLDSGGQITSTVSQVGRLDVIAPVGVSPKIEFVKQAQIIKAGSTLGLKDASGTIMNYRLGVSDGSCANAQWTDASATGVLTLDPSTSATDAKTYSVCVQAPSPLNGQTFTNGAYLSDPSLKVQLSSID